jgi:hypothetical protein
MTDPRVENKTGLTGRNLPANGEEPVNRARLLEIRKQVIGGALLIESFVPAFSLD